MIHKTHGIVFRFTKYGDTSIIVTIFTELFGLQHYIVNGVRSKSAKNRIALYQPLTLLDLVVYYRENANIKRIKELKCLHPYQRITTDIKRSAIALFLGEIINKVVREESHAQELCHFLIASFIALDSDRVNVENFHLVFLLKLSRFLGFGAQQANEVLHDWPVSSPVESLLQQLLTADYDRIPVIHYADRKELLEIILRFYQHHTETLGEVKSLEVLRSVLT
jgi:DNA repair protein RecO (recombination protein O)